MILDMTNILNNIQFGKLYTFVLSDIIQIIIIFLAMYYIIKEIKDTRAWIITKGIAIVFLIYAVVTLMQLTTIQYIIEQSFQFIAIAVIIMFQPELQRLLETIGKQDFKTWYKKLKKDKKTDKNIISNKAISEIAKACEEMSKVKTGALIVIEMGIPLTNVIESGIGINADITSQLLINVFEKNTPLHDGAVVIKDNKVRSATCYLPLSKNGEIQKSLGTRHRAGIGISETTDALVVIVSEETGEISFCENGRISHGITTEILKKKLEMVSNNRTDEIEESRHIEINRSKLITKIVVAIASVFTCVLISSSRDAVVTTTINNVNVIPFNTNVMETIGQTYKITSGDTVSVKVTGRKSIISDLTSDDIIAKADFRKMSQVYSVPIEVSVKGYDNDEIEANTANSDVMILELEDIIEKELPITVELIGNCTDGYYFTSSLVDIDRLKVSAPESKLNNITSAEVTINITGKSEEFISFATPILKDESGNKVDMNGVSISSEQVQVLAKAYRTKEIPILFNVSSSNEDERYELINYTLSSNTITIAGDEEKLNSMSNIPIDIDLSNSNDMASSILIDMSQYIDEDIFIVKESDKQISATVETKKFIKKSLKLNEDDIVIKGLGTRKTLNIDYIPEYIEYYINSEIGDISIDMLEPTLNISNESNGSHDGTINIRMINEVYIESDLSIKYTISKK